MLQVQIGIEDGLTPAMTVGVQVFEKVKPRRRHGTVVVFCRTLKTLVTTSAPPPPRMNETVVERRLRQMLFVEIIRGMTEMWTDATDLAHTVP